MAINTHRAPGAGAETQIGPTPAPLKPAAPDVISNVRAPGKSGLGMNGVQPSALRPGETKQSVLADNLRQSSNDQDGESILDRVQRLGVARAGDAVDTMAAQTRAVDATPFPPAFGMHRPDNSVRVPSHGGPAPVYTADDLLGKQPKLPTEGSTGNKPNTAGLNAKTNQAMNESSKPAGVATPGQLVAAKIITPQ